MNSVSIAHSVDKINADQAPYRFSTFCDKANSYLNTNGFCVIKNALNLKEVNISRNLLWDFLTSIGWDKRYSKTWNFTKEEGHWDVGIMWGHGIGHSKLQWFIRKNKNVLNTFAKLWNCSPNELITSFDGIGIFRPWYLNEKWKTIHSWYHIDQNTRTKPNRVTVQGYVCLYDQNETTGTMQLIPKSNLFTKDYKNVNISENNSSDYIGISKHNKLLKMKQILLCCKAGDLILWDSRTIHCNAPSILSFTEMKKIYLNRNVSERNLCKCLCILDELLSIFDNENEEEKMYDLLRAVCYVCMTPKYKATENVLIKRVKAYVYNYNLNHYPHEFAILKVPKLNEYPDYLRKKSVDDLDEMMKNLIGIDDNILKKCQQFL